MSDVKERFKQWEEGKVNKALSKFPERKPVFQYCTRPRVQTPFYSRGHGEY